MNEHRPVFAITLPVEVSEPGMFRAYARFAFVGRDQPVTIPPGTLLLYLGSDDAEQDNPPRHYYRRSNGSVVISRHPLSADEAILVEDPEMITSMNAFRTVDEYLEQDYGLRFSTTDALPPFALIRCPLCGGESFTSLDLAGVWCDHCNASFSVRMTAGDPGFVVECRWEHYHPFSTRYLIPPSHTLHLGMVLKDTGDPRDMNTSDCRCKRTGELALVGEDSSLRPGLHACQVGTLYEWSLIGRVPTPADIARDMSYQVGGQRWPATATQRVTPFVAYEETSALDYAIYQVEDQQRQNPELHLGETIRRLKEMRALKGHALDLDPWHDHLPPISALREGELYLLHHWAPFRSGESSHETVLPIWHVATPVVDGRYVTGLNVVRRDICPACGNRVLPEHAQALAGLGKGQ